MKNLTLSLIVIILLSIPVFAADGDIDTTFGGTGSRVTDIGGATNDVIFNVGVMADGRIVGMGGGNGQAAAIRYLPDGSLDTSFSGDGVATAFTGTGTAGALQTDGKPVVAGSIAGAMIHVVRFNTDGSPDTSFGGDGQATTGFGGNSPNIRAVLVQPDGKIVVAGTISFPSGDLRDIVLARFETDGTLDATFGAGGTAVIDLTPNATEVVFDAALQSDGKIIIAGQKNDGVGFADFLVARFNTDGSVDATFGTGGFTTVPVSTDNDLADSVAIAPDGKIVVGGIYTDLTATNSAALVRLTPNGSLDASFDGDGILKPESVNRPVAILVQPDGKFLTAGPQGSIYGISKYNADGTLDTSFSLDGRLSGIGSATALAVQPDGKILVSGSQTISGGNTGFLTARYLNTIAVPTAANVSISGRVCAPDGSGIARAVVYLTDANGNTRAAKTNSFGYFRFAEVAAGQSYVVSVSHREFEFAPRALNVNEDLYDLNFVAGGNEKSKSR